MNTYKHAGVIVLVLIIAGAIAFAYLRKPSDTPIDTVSYACNANKSITATYYKDSAALVLSDGRSLSLTETSSVDAAGGTRYSNTGETAVFWQKGNGATFTEGVAQTYMGCIMTAKDPGGLPLVYANGSEGFSIRYTAGYAVDAAYKYEALGPDKTIGGVKFTIPASLASGTNLSSDSYLSVEEIPNTVSCSAALFLEPGTSVSTVMDGGTTYSRAMTVGAGAGNRYEETVYAIPGTNPCMAVRYMVHYGVIENYPVGSVREFDKAALLSQFDAIRRTLVVLEQ